MVNITINRNLRKKNFFHSSLERLNANKTQKTPYIRKFSVNKLLGR